MTETPVAPADDGFKRNLTPAEAAAEMAAINGVDLPGSGAATPAPVREVRTTSAFSDNTVTLPTGYLDIITGDLRTEVEVRELTGVDEEILAKENNPARKVHMIIDRATVRIGDITGAKPLKEALDDMLVGDLESVLVGIRIATFGSQIKVSAACDACTFYDTSDYDLNTLRQKPSLPDPAHQTITVELRKGEAEVQLATGGSMRKLAGDTNKSVAERNTALLADCLISIRGEASRGIATARNLGWGDRDAITKAMAEQAPGPTLEAYFPCSSCGEEITAYLPAVAMFRL